MQRFFNEVFHFYYGDEENTDKKSEDKVEDKPDDIKKFSQNDLNRMLAEHKRTLQKTVEQQTAALEELKKNKDVSTQEIERATSQINELNNLLLTKEELAKKEKDKLEKEYKEKETKTTGERDFWKNKYTKSTIVQEIYSEAKKAKAFREEQIVNLLIGNARLVENLDATGKGTGEHSVLIKFNDVDKDGKPIELDLSVKETIKRMTELPEQYGNLFETTLNGGLGGNRTTGAKQKALKDMTPEEYRNSNWRKENVTGK